MMAPMTRWLPWIVCALLGALLGLGSYTFQYAEGLSYLSNDPQACVNCHVMQGQYDSWVRSSHRLAATCNDCHVPHAFPDKYIMKMRNGWNHSRAFTLQNYPEPIRIRPSNRAVLQHNCIQCHQVAVSEIAGHADVELGSARCTDCHRSVGHMSTY
jgi:cytochrome c nitrite reductase small subunit